MKILNRRKITASRRNLLLGSATLVFVLAIIAAMSFSFTPVVAQQKDTPDSETERLKKVAEELRRNPSQQAEEALKKAKAEFDRSKSEGKGNSVGDGFSRSEREEEEFAAKREAEMKVLTISRADLAKRANITMTQAINIATSQEPGTVMETRIVFERNGGETEEPFYVVTIVVEKDGLKSEKRVIVSGIDGSVGGPHNN